MQVFNYSAIKKRINLQVNKTNAPPLINTKTLCSKLIDYTTTFYSLPSRNALPIQSQPMSLRRSRIPRATQKIPHRSNNPSPSSLSTAYCTSPKRALRQTSRQGPSSNKCVDQNAALCIIPRAPDDLSVAPRRLPPTSAPPVESAALLARVFATPAAAESS